MPLRKWVGWWVSSIGNTITVLDATNDQRLDFGRCPLLADSGRLGDVRLRLMADACEQTKTTPMRCSYCTSVRIDIEESVEVTTELAVAKALFTI